MQPIQCLYDCFCYYNPYNRTNVYDCSYQNYTALPHSVQPGTNWLILCNNSLTSLSIPQTYFNVTSYIDVSTNNILAITDNIIAAFNKSNTLIGVNLTYNKLKSIPIGFRTLSKLQKIWMYGNPFDCNCDMTWMINWLNTTTVQDGKSIRCATGSQIGTLIYKLNTTKMGCGPTYTELPH